MHPRGFKVEPDQEGNTKVTGNCVFTQKEYSVTVKTEDYHTWLTQDKFAQDVFPYLSADDREFLISGISPEGFAKTFPDE